MTQSSSPPAGNSAEAPRKLMAQIRCPKCSFITVTMDSTPRVQPCEKCGVGLNLTQDYFDRVRAQAAADRAKRQAKEEERRRAGRKDMFWFAAILFGIIFGPPLISILFGPGVTTRGCSLSVDVIVLNHCWFGSFGLSILATIVIGGLLFVPKLLWSKAKDKIRK